MEIPLEELWNIPGYAVLVCVILWYRSDNKDCNKRLEKKDSQLYQALITFADFSTKFERATTLLDELVHGKRGDSHDRKD